MMNATIFHPATIRLLQLQSGGRRRRVAQRFCQPRRLVFSVIAGVFAVVWLGNAALTIWLRQSGSPETLRAFLSLGLVLYAGWHIAKAAFFRPESPFDGSLAERELLAAMPLRPVDLVAYQLASVTLTTVLKAGLLTLLLLPDMRCVPLGFAGVLLAMMTLELIRLMIDLTAWGTSRPTFLLYRTTVVIALIATGVFVGAEIVGSDILTASISVDDGLFHPLLRILVQLNDSVLGYAALPFQPFLDLILADQITVANVGLAAAALAIVTAASIGSIRLYAATVQRVANRERRNFQRDLIAYSDSASRRAIESKSNAACSIPARHMPYWGGAGALAWRQVVGARRHWGSLLTAMIAPAVLAFAPCLMISDPLVAFLCAVGTLAFYSFLLLPTALRFDFRRDLDRLATFKSLPITPTAAVVGQIFAPVLITTLFQTVLLALAVVARSLPPQYLIMAMLVMVPLNVLVFGLDNLIYLLYPYRAKQEGLEIFVRTMLTFTAKGLIFTAGLAVHLRRRRMRIADHDTKLRCLDRT